MANYYTLKSFFLFDLSERRDVDDDDVSTISCGGIISDYGIRKILISSLTMSRNFRR